MLNPIIFGFIVSIIAIGILAYPMFVNWRRDRIAKKPFPSHWLTIIEANLEVFTHLSIAQQQQIQRYVRIFLAEKQFIGCLGLQITEEIKVTIAAIACLLLLNNRGKYFPRLRTILVYPSAYIVQQSVMTDNYVVEERRSVRLGESWTNGQLVLAWDSVKRDTLNWKDGHNVVLHEFAHQLDQENGRAEGVPILSRKLDYAVWQQVMTYEYLKLCDDVKQNSKTVIDIYGATNPVEFFAVVTETFFEKPADLLKHHQALYELLQRYYQVDPIQWS